MQILEAHNLIKANKVMHVSIYGNSNAILYIVQNKATFSLVAFNGSLVPYFIYYSSKNTD